MLPTSMAISVAGTSITTYGSRSRLASKTVEFTNTTLPGRRQATVASE